MQWSEIPISTLSRQIDAASRAFVVIESLRSANMVIDTLGDEVVTDLLENLIQMQVLPYQLLGGVPGGDLFGLEKDKLDKRWELLYSVLGASSAPHMQRIMSPEWAVTFKLYVQFCRRTAVHLETLLDLEVERLYQRGREGTVTDSSARRQQERVSLDPALVQEHGNFVVQTLKSVLAVEQEVHKMFDDGVFALGTTGFVSSADADQTPVSFTCTAMSSVFDRYLDPFVQAERHNVQELIQTLVAEDVERAFPCQEPDPTAEEVRGRSRRASAAQPTPDSKKKEIDDSSVDMIAYASNCQSVFNSAEMLFQTIRSSLLRCASFSTGKPLLSLSMEYKVCIQIYAESVRTSLLPVVPTTAKRVGRRYAHVLSLEEEILACRAITTAERCIALIPQMQNEMGLKIRSDYAADVDMRAQCELLSDVLSWKCFDLFCARASGDFLDHFLALVMGLRKVSVVGAEQLLLDITDIKPLLLKLHHTSLPAKSFERQSMVVSQAYLDNVSKKSQLIELVLKLICTDDEQFEETFYIMWPEGQECDMAAIRNLRISAAAGAATAGRSNGTPQPERKSSSDSLSDQSPSRLGNAVESLRSKANVLSKFKIGRKKDNREGRDSF
ncbi:VPS53 [Symbiodinium microadriaticum]|nr:VPS53 [Symbiodinium microadriaticum]